MISSSGRKYVSWVCKCSCGKTKVVLSSNLLSGKTLSCGCVRNSLASDRVKTHGCSKEKLYGVWCSMKARCHNPHSNAYKDYGGRGISVCPEWRDSYISFKEWSISHGYNDALSLDRIDNCADYTPENCRWVTGGVQANNRRSNRLYTIDGVTHTTTEWAAIYGINPKTLFTRLYSGKSFKEAIEY